MIEEQVAERFRAAVAGEPPLGFDPDDVVTEAGRRRRRRQAVAATALATVAVALAAGAVFAATGPTQVDVGANPSVEPTPPSVPSTTLPGVGKKQDVTPPPPTFAGSDSVVANLGQVIPQVLRDRVPGLRFDKPDSRTLMVVEGHHAVGGAYLAAGTTHRYVSVWVYHDHDRLDLANDPAAGGGWGPLISDNPQPDGSRLRVYRSDDGAGDLGLTVLHFRTDGVIVQAETDAKPEPGRTGLAVNQQVLTAVATDPRLTF